MSWFVCSHACTTSDYVQYSNTASIGVESVSGTKEASFLYAISSAGLVHEFSRACSEGVLDRCTCDESNPSESKKAWQWGGCGDNIEFGLQFTRRFLKKGEHTGKDIRAKVDQHNSRVGIKVCVCRCMCTRTHALKHIFTRAHIYIHI